jgi:hypothetical protein
MKPCARPGCATAVLTLAAVAAAAGPPAPSASPWNTGTRPPAAAAPAPDGTSTVRVYEGFGTAGPLYGPRGNDLAYAIDVAAEVGTCPDGSRIVTAIEVAGARYPLEARCPSSATTPRAAGAARPGPDVTAIRCDARTWNCRSSP